MNRRHFLGSSILIPLAVKHAGEEGRQTPLVYPTTPPEPAARWHVFERTETRHPDPMRLCIRQLTDDAFGRAIESLSGRVFHLLDPSDRPMAAPFNTMTRIRDMRSFDVAQFREQTSYWAAGHQGCIGGRSYGAHTRDAFAGVTAVALGELPQAVFSAVNYLDKVTGFAMRAVSVYDIECDDIMLRLDVFTA